MSSGYSSGGCCDDGDIIVALDVGLTAIASAVQAISINIGQQQQFTCSQIQPCMDMIEQEMRRRFRSATASCDTCKTMLAQGLGGTIEFALQCAGVDVSNCNAPPQQQPQPCSGTNEGATCQGCGQSPCCCKGGVCEPCDPAKEKDYIGWCNQSTGVVVVTKKTDPPPGAGFGQVSQSDDAQLAFSEAQQFCGKKAGPFPKPPQLSPESSDAPFCDITSFSSTSAMLGVVDVPAKLFQTAAFAEVASATARLGLDGVNLGNFGEILIGIYKSISLGPPEMASEIAPVVGAALGCNSPIWLKGVQAIAAVGLTKQMTGVDLGQFATSIEYAMNASCRRIFVDPDKAIACYLANSMEYESLDTHWAINGICAADLDAYIDAARSKPIPFQLSQMRRRELIDADDYHVGMRRVGYLNGGERENLYKLTEQVPTLSDIIRLMVRDADDDSPNGPVVKFNLDAQFNQKYGRQLKQWSEWQGVPELFAKYAWRAHWEIPSPTALFNFWHRLRKRPGFEQLEQDIKTALIQQDILPYWHQHYLETNYLPLGRVDIRRSYQIGTLSDKEMETAISELGYSDENTDRLVKFTKRLRDISAAGHKAIKLWLKWSISRATARQRMVADGLPVKVVDDALSDAEIGFASSTYAASFVRGDLPRNLLVAALTGHGVSGIGASQIATILAPRITSHPAERSYAAGTMTRENAAQQMAAYGMNTDVIERMLVAIDSAILDSDIVNCQRGIKRRYLMGELDRMDATNLLQNRGTTPERARQLLDSWGCEKSSVGRQVPAAKLCKWLGEGIITGGDFTNRLEKLGYSAADAARMLNDCLIGVNLRLLAQAKRDAKEQATEQTRAQNALNRANATAQRAVAQQQRARNQAKATAVRREKMLLNIAEQLMAKCQCPLDLALPEATVQKNRLQSEFGLSIDESLQALTTAVENWEGGTLNGFSGVVAAMAQIIVSTELEPPIDESTGVVITNG